MIKLKLYRYANYAVTAQKIIHTMESMGMVIIDYNISHVQYADRPLEPDAYLLIDMSPEDELYYRLLS